MKQDLELKFDDDKDDKAEKITVDTDSEETKPQKQMDDIRVTKAEPEEIKTNTTSEDTPKKAIEIKVGPEPQATPEPKVLPETPEDSVEISDEIAYKVGVLIIGIPILLVLIIFGLTTSKTKPQTAKNKEKSTQKIEENIKTKETSSNTSTNKDISQSSGSTYKVKAGETLYGIGLKLDIDWKEIAELNDIEAPYDLKTNQELELPE